MRRVKEGGVLVRRVRATTRNGADVHALAQGHLFGNFFIRAGVALAVLRLAARIAAI